ncbi:uncharacterized protein LOC126560964 [Anopheles maculipalpis]|uniref:uncharacterized protein LOC126560964 n=1 Tax=Anopheles maculipalpis TaxID=1496333 RepID=UPI00215932EE|nr:uncharacterized protein LOC126560964 [Anopheles maculipalpis]
MDKKFNCRRPTINTFYAISLTPEQKRLLMQKIYNDIHQNGSIMSDDQVRAMCGQLNQCYEVRFQSIACAMEIIIKLLTVGVAKDEVIGSYRKLLSYVSNVLETDNCAKLANYLSRVSFIVLEGGGIVSSDVFPVSVMKCILVLMYRLPISNLTERQHILQAVRSTLKWCRHNSNLYKQCGIGTLVRSVIGSTRQLPNDVTVATELTVLAHTLLDVFYSPQTTTVHPVEVLLRLTYEEIFARLVTEWTDARSFELLLYVLYGMLKRDIFTHLKLGIVRLLADAIGGGTRRLVRLLCIGKHLQNGVLLHKVRTILTIVLSHSLFRFEPVKRTVHFRAFLKLIEKMIQNIDLAQLANARFLCLNIPRTKLTIESVCFVFMVRHLDLLDGISSPSLELDYIYNLIASVNIIYYKRWKVPSFLVKHFIDGLTRYSNCQAFIKNVSHPEKQIQAILSTGTISVLTYKTAENVFGRLPVTVHRIEWLLQLRSENFDEKLIFHQQIAILQERTILWSDDVWATKLLTMFSTKTLLAVLSTKKAPATARSNASVLLSKCSLTGRFLKKVLSKLASICQQQQQQQSDETATDWMNWLRAIYGTVHTMDGTSRRNLWCGLSNIEQWMCSNEQRMLLVDLRASLLVAMLPDGKANSERQ